MRVQRHGKLRNANAELKSCKQRIPRVKPIVHVKPIARVKPTARVKPIARITPIACVVCSVSALWRRWTVYSVLARVLQQACRPATTNALPLSVQLPPTRVQRRGKSASWQSSKTKSCNALRARQTNCARCVQCWRWRR